LADFGVERHTLVTEKITQVFHHSSTAVTQCSAARVHSSRGRAQLLGGLEIDLSHPGRILRFPSDPFERKARQHLLPGSLLDSNGGIIWGAFSRLGSVTLLADTFRVPERASGHIQGNPSNPFPSRPRRSF
jgi:hypothetical protein